MKLLLAALAIAAPTTAYAQSTGNAEPTMNMPNYSTYAPAIQSYGLLPPSDTPTMARQKLTRAIALRDEANRLRAADGGTLSPANLRYIQRKADAIRAGRY